MINEYKISKQRVGRNFEKKKDQNKTGSNSGPSDGKNICVKRSIFNVHRRNKRIKMSYASMIA